MQFTVLQQDLDANPILQRKYKVGDLCETTSFAGYILKLIPPVQLREEKYTPKRTPIEGYVEPTLEETAEETVGEIIGKAADLIDKIIAEDKVIVAAAFDDISPKILKPAKKKVKSKVKTKKKKPKKDDTKSNTD